MATIYPTYLESPEETPVAILEMKWFTPTTKESCSLDKEAFMKPLQHARIFLMATN